MAGYAWSWNFLVPATDTRRAEQIIHEAMIASGLKKP